MVNSQVMLSQTASVKCPLWERGVPTPAPMSQSTFWGISREGLLDRWVSLHFCDPGLLFVFICLLKGQEPPRRPSPQLCPQAPLCTWTYAIFPTIAIVRMSTLNFSREWGHPTTWWVGTTLLLRSPAGLSWMPCWKGKPSGAATCR